MRILVVSATEFEVKGFTDSHKNQGILISGAGVPASMYALCSNLPGKNYDVVIQAGIAGAFSGKAALGEVVLVQRDTFADLGVEENGNFKTIFDMGFADRDISPFKDGWLINEHPFLPASGLRAVKAITVNKLSDRHEQSRQFQEVFDADIESMEGAALHYVCTLMKIPFLQLRSISNVVGERDKSKWLLKQAIQNLNTELSLIIQKLV